MTKISNKSVENPIIYRTLQSYLDDKGLKVGEVSTDSFETVFIQLENVDNEVVECWSVTTPLKTQLFLDPIITQDLINSLLILDLYTYTGQLYHTIAFDYEFNTIDVKHLF